MQRQCSRRRDGARQTQDSQMELETLHVHGSRAHMKSPHIAHSLVVDAKNALKRVTINSTGSAFPHD